jgi:hypothetical protein
VRAAEKYAVREVASGKTQTKTGAELRAGLAVRLKAGEELRLEVSRVN